MNRIYMDNAATTRVTQPVLEAMMPCLTDVYGNPSSVHAFGRDARRLLDEARAAKEGAGTDDETAEAADTEVVDD